MTGILGYFVEMFIRNYIPVLLDSMWCHTCLLLSELSSFSPLKSLFFVFEVEIFNIKNSNLMCNIVLCRFVLFSVSIIKAIPHSWITKLYYYSTINQILIVVCFT